MNAVKSDWENLLSEVLRELFFYRIFTVFAAFCSFFDTIFGLLEVLRELKGDFCPVFLSYFASCLPFFSWKGYDRRLKMTRDDLYEAIQVYFCCICAVFFLFFCCFFTAIQVICTVCLLRLLYVCSLLLRYRVKLRLASCDKRLTWLRQGVWRGI